MAFEKQLTDRLSFVSYSESCILYSDEISPARQNNSFRFYLLRLTCCS